MKVIQFQIIKADTAEQAIKIAKKGTKQFELIKCDRITCFEITAAVYVKEGVTEAKIEKTKKDIQNSFTFT